jgi:hypothetical protein
MGQSSVMSRGVFSVPSRPDPVGCDMARTIFFSFHYQRDLWRVNVVRNSGAIEGISAAGFHDVSYEIERSVARGNGLLGVRINYIKGRDGRVDAPGLIPGALTKLGVPIYTYEYGKLGEWVEKAYKTANPGI